MAVFNFTSNTTANADQVMGNDRTAGWGEDILPRTDRGTPLAGSDVQFGTYSYPFNEIVANRVVAFYDSGRLDIRQNTVSTTRSINLNTLTESYQTAWTANDNFKYFHHSLLILTSHGSGNEGIDRLNAFYPYDPSTVATGQDVIRVWSLYNKQPKASSGTRLELDAVSKELSLFLNTPSANNDGIVELSGGDQNRIWYAHNDDPEELLLNKIGETVDDRWSWARVILF